MRRDTTDEQREAQYKLWPGFTVQCRHCDDFNVYLDNSMGFSAMSGSWGSIDFVCLDCGTRTALMEA